MIFRELCFIDSTIFERSAIQGISKRIADLTCTVLCMRSEISPPPISIYTLLTQDPHFGARPGTLCDTKSTLARVSFWEK